ncbi:MAG: insulinase family protein [Hyphomicrobiales bacterium]|nr:insulinase family protein [Hyphomicrobiales bacterium]
MAVRTSTLENGLRVVTHHMPHLETVSLGVWIGSGARSERVDEHGIAHLMEHMAFKGTMRRSAREIAEEIESVGGELNAATSLESTTFVARVLKDDVRVALDLLGDILQQPRFDRTELAREQGVVLQEIAASQDVPDDIAFDLMQEAAYPDQPLGRPILGTPESVRSICPEHLSAYLASRYSAANMVLGAAGALSHEAVVDAAGDLMTGLRKTPVEAPEPARYRGGVRGSAKPFEQVHLVVAYEGPSYRADDIYTAQVFSGLFGGGMSSRLFQEVRERRGLCYSIYSFGWGLSDTGLFGVHAATGPEQLAELTDVLAAEFARATEALVGEEEVARSKAQLKAGLMMGLESSSSRAEQLARQLLVFDRTFSNEELMAKVEAVTPEKIRALAQRLFAGTRPSLACVGASQHHGEAEALADKFDQTAACAAE